MSSEKKKKEKKKKRQQRTVWQLHAKRAGQASTTPHRMERSIWAYGMRQTV